MATPLVISTDLETIESLPQQGLQWRTISYLNHVLIPINPTSIEKAVSLLQSHFRECDFYFDVTALENIQDIVSLLDKGATRVFVQPSQFKLIFQENILEDLARLIVVFENATKASKLKEEIAEVLGDSKSGVFLRNINNWELWNELSSNPMITDSGDQYVSITHELERGCGWSYKHGFVPIVSASALTAEPEKSRGLVSVGTIIAAAISSDRADGLYTTVVQNERGDCLGLVYSNDASILASLQKGVGVYKSRKREALWVKGEISGDTQELVKIGWDCDCDTLLFTVRQRGDGFCHLKTATCFGPYSGLSKLEQTLQSRKQSAPPGSYTARLFNDPKLLQAKIMEEASELCEADSKDHIAAEAADLLYFAFAKCVAAGVSLADIESNLDRKSMKTTRRKGDAKPQWAEKVEAQNGTNSSQEANGTKSETVKEAASVPKANGDSSGIRNDHIQMKRYKTSSTPTSTIKAALQRPSQRSTEAIMTIVKPIISRVRSEGDTALLAYTHQFEKATSLTTPILRAPFPPNLMQLSAATTSAIDTSYENIRRFHSAQRETHPLTVETMSGVLCTRFSRPIERVGLYVPGGTAVLPSTALMLGVPAQVAGCKTIVLASPPRADGSISPEIVYIAHKVGAEGIVLAGGAQAVAAMAYGTESVTKVDKILGPGNQFVTAAKMLVANDTNAGVSIDMPAGPSEVLVIADRGAEPAFVASDLLSQAEHGVDSQVVLIAVGMGEEGLEAIEGELDKQARALPRVDIVRGAIEHSVTLVVGDVAEAMRLSNEYAPEHLILQLENAEEVLGLVENAGSVFVGKWTPESVGDYSAGVNHSLPTYGYAKQYSGVNLSSFIKHITSSRLTKEGLKNVGGAVMQLAKVEQLEAHRRAVGIRLEHMESLKA